MESKMEKGYRFRPSSKEIKEIIEDYVKIGLTLKEASDLVTLQSAERQGSLFDSERKRKEAYLKKLEKLELKKRGN